MNEQDSHKSGSLCLNPTSKYFGNENPLRWQDKVLHFWCKKYKILTKLVNRTKYSLKSGYAGTHDGREFSKKVMRSLMKMQSKQGRELTLGAWVCLMWLEPHWGQLRPAAASHLKCVPTFSGDDWMSEASQPQHPFQRTATSRIIRMYSNIQPNILVILKFRCFTRASTGVLNGPVATETFKTSELGAKTWRPCFQVWKSNTKNAFVQLYTRSHLANI